MQLFCLCERKELVSGDFIAWHKSKLGGFAQKYARWFLIFKGIHFDLLLGVLCSQRHIFITKMTAHSCLGLVTELLKH